MDYHEKVKNKIKQYLDEYEKSPNEQEIEEKFIKRLEDDKATLELYSERNRFCSYYNIYNKFEFEVEDVEADVDALIEVLDSIKNKETKDEIRSYLNEFLFECEDGNKKFLDRYLSFCKRVLTEASNKFKPTEIVPPEVIDTKEAEKYCHPYSVYTNYIPEFDTMCYVNHGIIEFRAYCKSIHDDKIVDEFMMSDFFMYHPYDNMTEKRIPFQIDELLIDCNYIELINEAMETYANVQEDQTSKQNNKRNK